MTLSRPKVPGRDTTCEKIFLILNLSKNTRQKSEYQLLSLAQHWLASYLLGKDINFTDWTAKKKAWENLLFQEEGENGSTVYTD